MVHDKYQSKGAIERIKRKAWYWITGWFAPLIAGSIIGGFGTIPWQGSELLVINMPFVVWECGKK